MKYYVTLTGLNYRYGTMPFAVGQKVRLVKEPENQADREAIRAELPDMFAQGISSFKMYLTYPAMMIGDRDIYWALKELRGLGGIAGFHCENAGVIDGICGKLREKL